MWKYHDPGTEVHIEPTTNIAAPADMVLVPVPVRLLPDVYRLLGQLMPFAEPTFGGEAQGEGESVLVDAKQGRWTKSMVERLAAAYHHPGVRALLDMAAERAPKQVTLHEVEQATGILVKTARGQLSALSSITKNLFQETTWPFSVQYGEKGTAYYSMNETVAKWWKEVTEK